MTNDAPGAEGLAAALSDISERTRELIRAEIDTARGELQRKIVANVPALLLAAVASGAAVGAAASSYRLGMQLIERMLPPPYAAAAATVGFGAVACAASVASANRLRRAPMPFPGETLAATRDGAVAAASAP
jgi:hypothetical protein